MRNRNPKGNTTMAGRDERDAQGEPLLYPTESLSQRMLEDDARRCCCCGIHIKTVVTTVLPCDMMTAYLSASSTDGLPEIFPGKGAIPGVKKAWIKGGGEQKVGAVRICNTTDGNEVAETYIQWNPPYAYAYEMTQLKAPLSLMLKKATGTWEFSEVPGGTKVVWHYFGEWTNVLIMPVTSLIVKSFLHDAMALCLEKLHVVVKRKVAEAASQKRRQEVESASAANAQNAPTEGAES